MRPTLLVLACLMTFTLAQNVLAIAPAQTSAAVEGQTSMTSPRAVQASFVPSPKAAAPQDGVPMSAMALLLVGLSGLTIAGGRRHDRVRSAA